MAGTSGKGPAKELGSMPAAEMGGEIGGGDQEVAVLELHLGVLALKGMDLRTDLDGFALGSLIGPSAPRLRTSLLTASLALRWSRTPACLLSRTPMP
jgi:hypothetical protein